MNRPFAFRLGSPSTQAVRVGVLTVWLVQTGMSWAQFPAGESVPPMAAVPLQPPWPAVDWGILTPKGSWENEPSVTMAPVPFTPGGDTLDLAPNIAPASSWLGPVDGILPLRPGVPGIGGPENGSAGAGLPGLQIGNVAFNHVANSLNVRETDVPKVDDLSRQFPVVLASPSIVEAVPLNGWAVLGIAVVAILVAVAAGYFENDRRERRHRRAHRHRHRSQRHRSS